MSCPVCASIKQVEFCSEMIVHYSGLKNVDNPGVMLYPKLSFCLDCGFAQFTVAESELALLVATPPRGRLTMAAAG
jgi:hypothetical protein